MVERTRRLRPCCAYDRDLVDMYVDASIVGVYIAYIWRVVCVGPSYILCIFYLDILVTIYISKGNTYMGNKLPHYIHCTCIYIVTREKVV